MLLFAACGGEKSGEVAVAEEKVVAVPDFIADSAYNFIQNQVDFGPRVPNTEAHRLTGDYLFNTLESYGAKVQDQRFQALTFDGVKVDLRNIIASFYPDKAKRILLAAHWDTRPFADKDEEDPNTPIAGANDGGSGVGVLLEIARVLDANPPPSVGVDIIFFDGEDWGTWNGEADPPLPANQTDWWCLGSQHWAKNKHINGYTPYYGILLDMVGARGSQFHKEGLSQKIAPKIVKKVWDRAAKIGYGDYFIHQEQAAITDDHQFVYSLGNILMIDIVHYDPQVGYFGDYHHTHKDNMEIIDTNTLKAVGQTVLTVLFYE